MGGGAEGRWEGTLEGSAIGTDEGDVDGAELLLTLGCCDGTLEGALVGAREGHDVIAVGMLAGTWDGYDDDALLPILGVIEGT